MHDYFRKPCVTIYIQEIYESVNVNIYLLLLFLSQAINRFDILFCKNNIRLNRKAIIEFAAKCNKKEPLLLSWRIYFRFKLCCGTFVLISCCNIYCKTVIV